MYFSCKKCNLITMVTVKLFPIILVLSEIKLFFVYKPDKFYELFGTRKALKNNLSQYS